MFKTKTTLLILLAALFVISTTGCTKGGDSVAISAYKKEKIVWWRVWDNEDRFSDLLKAYKQLHPNVTVEYRKLRYDEYEKELIDALAEDRGPDVFSIHNTWMERYQSKLLPVPAQTKVPVKYLEGSVKKEEVVRFVSNLGMTPLQLKKKFLDVVAKDVIMTDKSGKTPVDKIWGLPVSMDTLVMYYNKDLLNNAGIIEPPKNWSDFQEQVKNITKINKDTGEILVAGAAIGTAKNVERNFDILSLLMMQNLAPMLDDNGNPTFDKIPKGLTGVEQAPAVGALEFYMQFASPLFEGYCWNKDMPNSIEAFIAGKAAFAFGYSYHRDQIVAKAPKLNFAMAAVPQVGEGQKVNYASYWVETVSKKTKVKDYAWDFIQFITDEKNVVKYLEKAEKTTALRSSAIINAELANENLGVAADQLLTAKSWYHGQSPATAEKAFVDMIEAVIAGELDTKKAIKQAVEQVAFSINEKL